MASASFLPVAGANSPVDGYAKVSGVDQPFSTIRAGSGSLAGASTTFAEINLVASSTTNKFKALTRVIICFDTSSIPDAAVITSAVLSVQGVSKVNFLGSAVLHVAGATPNTTNNVIASDYSQVQNTSFGNVSYSSFERSGNNPINLNSTGINNIDKSGVTKFSLRTSWDLNNSFTGTWHAGDLTGFTIWMSDAGSSDSPSLFVEWVLYGEARVRLHSVVVQRGCW